MKYNQYCIVEFNNCAPVVHKLTSRKPITIDTAYAYFRKAEGFNEGWDSLTFVDEPMELVVR